MTAFEEFLRDLDGLVESHAKNGLALKVQADNESGMIRIFGDGATPLYRARRGLDDVLELAQATAEHHPLWGMLDHSAEVASAVLERWQADMSASDIKEAMWHIGELGRSAKKLADGITD